MKFRFPVWILLLAISTRLSAVESTIYDSATVDSRWLSIPGSARLAALSGSTVARHGELAGVEVNPATLAGIKGFHAALTHNLWVQGISTDRLTAGLSLGCFGTVGASYDYLNLGEVTRVDLDSSGQPFDNGTIHPYAMALGASWAADFGGLSAGVSVRGLFEQVVQGYGGGASADLGLQYSFESGWRAGASLQNMDLNFSSGTLRPFRWRLGGGYTYGGTRPVALDVNTDFQPNDSEPATVRLGAEWAAHTQWILRGGYLMGNERTAHGPTAGIGWVREHFTVDYAVFGAGDLGLSHLFTIGFAGVL